MKFIQNDDHIKMLTVERVKAKHGHLFKIAYIMQHLHLDSYCCKVNLFNGSLIRPEMRV